MEHYLATGLRNVDGLLRAEEKRGELGRRRWQLGGPELLDMPLGVKIPLLPGANPVFYRTKLGEKLHRPCGYFNLGDPYCRLLSNEYHSLHDPHLRAYYNRKDNLRRLKREGYLTRDGKVVCTLREFNEYRQYLTTLKIEMDKMYRREQKTLREQLAKLKNAPELAQEMDVSRLRERLLWEQRESLRAAEQEMRARYLAMIAESMEKPEALEEDKHLPQQAEPDQKSVTEEVHHKVQATLIWSRLTEAQELEELAESVLREVLERVKELDPPVRILRRAPLAISGRLFATARRAEPSETSPPDLQQEIALVARELAATLLDHLGEPGACSTSDAPEPRLSARRRQQRVAGGATRAGKLGESRARQAEEAGYDGASPLPSLDPITKDAVESVGATLQSFVACQFERHFQCKCSDILRLPLETLSRRPPQPPQAPVSTRVTKEGQGSPGASEHRTPEATRLPLLQPLPSVAAASPRELARGSIQNALSQVQHLHSELKVYAEMVVRDALEALKKEKKLLQRERNAKTRALQDSSEESTVERGLAERLLEPCGRPPEAVASRVTCGRRLAKQPRPRDGKESSLGQDFLRPEGKTIPAKKLEKRQPSPKLPPISIPGMVMPSEAEAQLAEQLSPNLLPSILRGSEPTGRHPEAPVQPLGTHLKTLYAGAGKRQGASPSRQ